MLFLASAVGTVAKMGQIIVLLKILSRDHGESTRPEDMNVRSDHEGEGRLKMERDPIELGHSALASKRRVCHSHVPHCSSLLCVCVQAFRIFGAFSPTQWTLS